MPRQISVTRDRIRNLLKLTISKLPGLVIKPVEDKPIEILRENEPQLQPILPIEEIETKQMAREADEFKPIMSISPDVSTEDALQPQSTSPNEVDDNTNFLPGNEITVDQISGMRALYKANRLDIISKHTSGGYSDAYLANLPKGSNIIINDATELPKSKGVFQDTQSCWFSKDIIEQLINQPGCEGIRIYYSVYGVKDKTGLKDEDSPKNGYHNAILVGLRLNEKYIGKLIRERSGNSDARLSDEDLDNFVNEQVPNDPDSPGKFYTLFEDMLEENDQVALPGRFQSESSTSFDSSDTIKFKATPRKMLAFDFGGLGPPMEGPSSVL